MILKEHELLQIDEKFINQLREQDPDALAGLSIKLASDLKEVLERLNQNPSNSSRPSGSLAPWDKGGIDEDDELNIDEKEALRSKSNTNKEESSGTVVTKENSSPSEKPKGTDEQRRPGRQPGSQGFGRTQRLANTDTIHHQGGCCSACDTDISSVEKAYTGFQAVNVEFGNTDSPGLSLTVILHLYYLGLCPKCGLENRTEPLRAPTDTSDWRRVGMTEWRLVGPDLAALIVYLSLDMRVTRSKVKQFLKDVLGLELSIGTIQNCIVESARALAPVEKQLLDDLCNESLIHADETSHNEAGAKLWLWVFVSSRTALFLIGHRTDEIFVNVFDALIGFAGHLMTDGYGVYRTFLLRLRCWAHLLRKARGLSDSLTETWSAGGNHYE